MSDDLQRDLYEVVKTVRFNLEPVKINLETNKDKQKITVEVFVKKYKNFVHKIEDLFFKKYEKSDSEVYFNTALKVQKQWLRVYCKREFYDYNLKGKFGKSGWLLFKDCLDVDKGIFLETKFKKWLVRNQEYIENLEKITELEEHEQKRRSDIAYNLHQINTRSNFQTIYELFKYGIQAKNDDVEIKQIQQDLEEIKSMIEFLEENYLPTQSMGRVIEKASFNYFTVNKKPKDYDKEITNLHKKYDKPSFDFKNRDGGCKFKYPADSGFSEHIKSLPDNYFVEQDFNGHKKLEKKFERLKLQFLYQEMKKYKAEQKSAFLQFVTKKRAFKNLEDAFNYETSIKKESGESEKITKQIQLRLFNDILEDNFNKISELSEKIENLSTQKNQLDKNSNKAKELQTKIDEEKKVRGKHFDVQQNYCIFSKYKQFCGLFKNVAIEYGQIKAKVKALEKEKIEAEKVNSWAVILEKDSQKYLLTIPRKGNNNLSRAYKFIQDQFEKQQQNDWTLWTFESLTLRALEKLCFGYDRNNELGKSDENKHDEEKINTFVREVETELNDKNFLEKGKLQRKDQIFKSGGEENLIRLYKTILSLNSTKRMLNLESFSGFDEFLKKTFKSLDKFGVELEKVCYVKNFTPISENTKNNILQEFKANLFKITSYDLEGFGKNPERHTKIWLDFWRYQNDENQYPIKLNPELKISFVKERKDEVKNRELGELAKNRRLTNKYLLTTTISLNSNSKTTNLAFKETDEIINKINTYKEDFNSQLNPFNTYYFGLDRGQKELLTLGIFKFKNQDVKTGIQDKNQTEITFKKPEPFEIDCVKLTEDELLKQDEKGRIAWKNLSYFPELLNKQSIQKVCVDLSCAKLIKDKIVLNGDVATYLNLKIFSAKRTIYEIVTKNRYRSEQICFDGNKNTLFINIENRGQIENENIYFYDERYASFAKLDDLKQELQEYFDNLRRVYTEQKKADNSKTEVVSVEKINNLRDAICANQVGIINFLYEKLSKQNNVMFVFEDLDIENKNKRILEFSGNLASRIEFKLLQKFHTKCLVPQNYKQVMNLQSKKLIDQFGIISYIETKGTSSNCSYCGSKNPDRTEKWSNHAFKCSVCSFDSSDPNKRKGLDFCDNSDSVAAYNIAKRGLELISKTN